MAFLESAGVVQQLNESSSPLDTTTGMTKVQDKQKQQKTADRQSMMDIS
jgi:hypothetical protein